MNDQLLQIAMHLICCQIKSCCNVDKYNTQPNFVGNGKLFSRNCQIQFENHHFALINTEIFRQSSHFKIESNFEMPLNVKKCDTDFQNK